MKSKYGLDKFYTKESIAKELIKEIDLSQFSTVIEPSAGSGSFSKNIEGCLAYDLEPENSSITKQDFFTYNPKKLKGPILVIGNPPFGRNGSLALAFIKKAAEFADTIAFILPLSFRKQSFYDKTPLNFWLVKEIILKENSFTFDGEDYSVPCVFQIYEKREEKREKQKKIEPKTFVFTTKEKANVAIRRVGVYAGKAHLSVDDKSLTTHYFIWVKNPKDFANHCNSIIWEHNNTVGPRSISKPELIHEIEASL